MKEECSSATELFQKLWTNDVKEHFYEFMNIIQEENKNIKGRAIQLASLVFLVKCFPSSVNHKLYIFQPTDSEYITLRALLIAAPMFSNMGTQLWHSDSVNRKKKKRKKLLREKVDYGIYIKQWMFMQLKLLLPKNVG